ncbi:MAG: hypothetical protein V1929_00870 [bacterium]
MADEQESAVDIGPEDIVFNCPKCGKSLTIDARASGLMVPCPDCGTQVMVPTPGEASDADEMLTPDEMQESLARLVDRIHELEKIHAMDGVRLEKINEQVALIQAAIDRVVSIIQHAQTTASPDATNDVGEG